MSQKWNDLIADTLLAPPLMSTARLQRQDHTAHHHYLGTKDDPDHGLHNDTSLKHYREGRFDHTDFLSLFLYDLLDPHLFVQSALGSLRAAPLQLLSWWLVAALVSGMLEPPVPLASSPPLSAVPFGWRFLALFHLARCTFSYAVYVLRETIDHSGLPAASVLAFTRTSPCCNALQRFLQPHDDNYHLLHHLLPRVPMSRLHAVHLWLVQNVPEYEQANRKFWCGLSVGGGGVADRGGCRIHVVLPRRSRALCGANAWAWLGEEDGVSGSGPASSITLEVRGGEVSRSPRVSPAARSIQNPVIIGDLPDTCVLSATRGSRTMHRRGSVN